jgi:hypothetical protein
MYHAEPNVARFGSGDLCFSPPYRKGCNVERSASTSFGSWERFYAMTDAFQELSEVVRQAPSVGCLHGIRRV